MTSPRIHEIVLHIGMHKTGSTAIQTALAGYDQDGVRYAQLGRPNHSVSLMLAFDPEASRETGTWVRHFGFTRRTCDQISAKAHADLDRELSLDRRSLIFSGEALSVWTEQAVIALSHRIRGCSEKIRVIGYVRDPVGYANSIVQQRIKGRGLPLHRPLRYQQSLDPYMTAFGRDHVHMRLYDRNRLRQGSVVADFAQEVGISGVDTGIQTNVSASFDAVRLLHLLAGHIPIPVGHPRLVQGWQRLCDWLQQALSGPPLQLPDRLARAFVTKADLLWLDQVFGIKFDTEGHPEMPMMDDALDAAIRSYLLDGVDDLKDGLAEAMQRCPIRFDDDDDVLNLMSRAYTHFVFDAAPTVAGKR